MKKKIIIKGEVHGVGCGPFLLGIAESLEMKRLFADNDFYDNKKVVFALLDAPEEKVNAFIEIVNNKKPGNAGVEEISIEDYKGNVMKIENYYRYLSSMQLGKIASYGKGMLEKQDSSLGKMDLMLEKQEETISVIREESEKTRETVKEESESTRVELKGVLESGFNGLKEEHIKTRELSKEIFYSEVQELRQELRDLRSAVEEIRRKVEAI